MQTREKILLCVVGYIIAVVLWFSGASQALTEHQTKSDELDAKLKEQTELKIKLSDLSRLQQEKVKLEGEIDQLRGSVPKSPDIDILIIDLEKMALESGLDLVSVEEPDKDKLRATEAADQEAAAPKGAKAPPKPDEGPRALGPAPGADKAKPVEVETGLVKQFMIVSAQGNYAGAVEFMKKLQAYQRVIGVSQVEVGYPTEGKEQKDLDSNELKISFLIPLYSCI
jgi:Tfp pilus assembly protein PilO